MASGRAKTSVQPQLQRQAANPACARKPAHDFTCTRLPNAPAMPTRPILPQSLLPSVKGLLAAGADDMIRFIEAGEMKCLLAGA